MVLELISAPFWNQNRIQKSIQGIKIASKNRSKKGSVFFLDFGRVLDRFLVQFRFHLASKMPPLDPIWIPPGRQDRSKWYPWPLMGTPLAPTARPWEPGRLQDPQNDHPSLLKITPKLKIYLYLASVLG